MIPRRAGLLALGLVAAGAIAWTAISQTEQATADPSAPLSPDAALSNGTDAAPAKPVKKAAPMPPPVTT